MAICIRFYSIGNDTKSWWVPEKREVRDYNPCNDAIMVPDTDHPDFPAEAKALIDSNDFAGPSFDGVTFTDIQDNQPRKLKVMNRYESWDLYNRLSR